MQKPNRKTVIRDNNFTEESAEKINSDKDFFDVSAVFGKWAALKIIRVIYHTSITPPQVTVVAFFFGMAAAFCLTKQNHLWLVTGAFLVQVKNIFDTVDGHLARARNTPSRIGRFLDSVTDFITNFAFFIAIGLNLSQSYSFLIVWTLTLIAFLSSVLQCSYYVFYTISYLDFKKRLTASRIDESLTGEDNAVYDNPRNQKILMVLHRLFLIFYGWQDRLAFKIDKWSYKGFEIPLSNWYCDRKMLTMTSFMGLGIHLFFLSLFAAMDQLYLYLWFVVVIQNSYWLLLIFYRRMILAADLRR